MGNSDHAIISLDVLFKPKHNNSTEKVVDFKYGDLGGLRNFLDTVPWMEELRGLETEEAWQHFKGKVSFSVDLYIPKISRRNHNRPTWMTKTVRRLIRAKQRHYNTYMSTRTDHNWLQFKHTEKLCKKAVRSAKRKI